MEGQSRIRLWHMARLKYLSAGWETQTLLRQWVCQPLLSQAGASSTVLSSSSSNLLSITLSLMWKVTIYLTLSLTLLSNSSLVRAINKCLLFFREQLTRRQLVTSLCSSRIWWTWLPRVRESKSTERANLKSRLLLGWLTLSPSWPMRPLGTSSKTPRLSMVIKLMPQAPLSSSLRSNPQIWSKLSTPTLNSKSSKSDRLQTSLEETTLRTAIAQLIRKCKAA